jgi:radical SAM protein with 4Fe4S-binding SPASM domain
MALGLNHLRELKLEITERCNSRCSFCHQNFGEKRRRGMMDSDLALRCIKWASDEGVKYIRFTGGEPTLHPGLEHFCRVAAEHGLKVVINTNGLGSFAKLKRISHAINILKVSLPSPVPDVSDSLTQRRDSLRRKLDTMALGLESAILVDALTVMVPQNIGLMVDFLELLANFPGVTWSPLRMESSATSPRPVNRDQLQRLAEELDTLRTQFPGIHKLGLATPFCSVEPPELGARVFSGRAEGCGPFHSLTVDVQGSLMSCYSCRTPLRHVASVHGVLDHPEVTRLTSKGSLPIGCRNCRFVDRCMGGCASPYATEVRDWGIADYLSRQRGIC